MMRMSKKCQNVKLCSHITLFSWIGLYFKSLPFLFLVYTLDHLLSLDRFILQKTFFAFIGFYFRPLPSLLLVYTLNDFLSCYWFILQITSYCSFGLYLRSLFSWDSFILQSASFPVIGLNFRSLPVMVLVYTLDHFLS